MALRPSGVKVVGVNPTCLCRYLVIAALQPRGIKLDYPNFVWIKVVGFHSTLVYVDIELLRPYGRGALKSWVFNPQDRKSVV